MVVANLPEPGATVAARVLDAADVFVCSSPEAAESWSATLEEDGRADARTSMTVVRSASDAAGWRSSAAPVREVVRRPWTVRRQRRTPSSWTEDAQVVLEHRQAEIDALKTGIDELREVVDHQEAQLARLRRLPGFTTVKRVARLWQRVRDRGATGEG